LFTWDFIPVDCEYAVGQVPTMGTTKYAQELGKGFEYSRVYSALRRHLVKWWNRQEIDPESCVNHLVMWQRMRFFRFILR